MSIIPVPCTPKGKEKVTVALSAEGVTVGFSLYLDEEVGRQLYNDICALEYQYADLQHKADVERKAPWASAMRKLAQEDQADTYPTLEGATVVNVSEQPGSYSFMFDHEGNVVKNAR